MASQSVSEPLWLLSKTPREIALWKPILSFSRKTPQQAEAPYECGEAASTGGDLELAIEVSDGAGGEKALDQQQHSKHKESSCQAVDDVLQDSDAVGDKTDPRCQRLMCVYMLHWVLFVDWELNSSFN